MLVRRSKVSRSGFSALVLNTSLVASGALADALLHAGTPSSDTVKVGCESKKAIGVVTGLEAGDVACYITLHDDQGISFQELADFAICEKSSLVGKRVKLAYRMENVMADECQGNPDWTKSKKVALVISAKVLAVKPTKAAPPAVALLTPGGERQSRTAPRSEPRRGEGCRARSPSVRAPLQ